LSLRSISAPIDTVTVIASIAGIGEISITVPLRSIPDLPEGTDFDAALALAGYTVRNAIEELDEGIIHCADQEALDALLADEARAAA
jgi:hypothetical protein